METARKIETIEGAIQASIPKTFDEDGLGNALFKFNRALMTIFHDKPELNTPEFIRGAVSKWHQYMILTTKQAFDFDDCHTIFWDKRGSAVVPLGVLVLEAAMIEAQRMESPKDLLEKTEGNKRLADLGKFCFCLSAKQKNGVFYLSCRDAGKIMGGLSHTKAAQMLRALTAMKVLKLEDPGKSGSGSGTASTYRWLLAKP